MALTAAQLQALRAAIDADPVLAAIPLGSDGDFQIAAAFNQPASPAFYVWKTSVSVADAKDVLNYTAYIGRSQGERDAFAILFSNHVVNPSRANVRQAIQDIFSGPGATPVAQRAAFDALFKRTAKRGEALFATGTGSEGSPATMTFEGNVSYQDVGDAREL